MVVLAASICTHGGKALLSRQFRELTKDRITMLLAAFPTLISNSNSQHTTVEDENVRYVYQPLEEFYIVLITNKSSNILEDIDTLHLFGLSVSNMLRSIDEKEIFDSAFEILSAFDEIINLGFKENLTISKVQTFLEMVSHEEMIQEIIERNKELEANEERRRKAKEIQRKELARKYMESTTSNANQAYNAANINLGDYSSQLAAATVASTPSYTESTMEGYGSSPSAAPSSSISGVPRGPRHGGGLQLGKKKAPTAHLGSSDPAAQSLLNQEVKQLALPSRQPGYEAPEAPQHVPAVAPRFAESRQASSTPVPSAPKHANNGILITIIEKITASINRDGSINSSEVKGDLQLRINNEEYANSKILLEKTSQSKAIQFKTHPNVDRSLFVSGSVIGLKKGKSFPSNDQALGVLRWQAKSDEADYLPIIYTVWTSVDDGLAQVTIEYELNEKFLENNVDQDVLLEDIKLIIGSEDPHSINLTDSSNENVSYDVDGANGAIVFTIDKVTSDEPSGTIEFSLPVYDEDALFPIQTKINYTNTNATESDTCFAGIKIVDVVSNDDGEESLPFDLHSNIVADSYTIV
ncbi:uncharacterized protein KQ657_000760 [Scheffersomyces spartinae]|uniref:Coatomer subunit delta n=1 Tax=Scheffersomyces spartinae TaxID=45513 RepID=A0A9P7V9J3_9ASCO|nr:uncharacterized protein KQ657_000760 [Scheffersomyces spartinae]KAG7193343.1 hypothetical protein KQ657_000760 [Scheffersomyces spartinae]